MNTKSISLRIIISFSLAVTALCPTARGMEQGTAMSIALLKQASQAPKFIATKMYEYPWYALGTLATLATGWRLYQIKKELNGILKKAEENMPAPTSYQKLGQKIEFVENVKHICDPEINRFMDFEYAHTQGKHFYIGRLTYKQNPQAIDPRKSYTLHTLKAQLQKLTGPAKIQISSLAQTAIAEEIYFRLDATRRIQLKFKPSDSFLETIQQFLEKQLSTYQRENQQFRVEAYEKPADPLIKA